MRVHEIKKFGKVRCSCDDAQIEQIEFDKVEVLLLGGEKNKQRNKAIEEIEELSTLNKTHRKRSLLIQQRALSNVLAY